MKPHALFAVLLAAGTVALHTGPAAADDAGSASVGGSVDDRGTEDGGADSSAEPEIPLACGGSLCDTTIGSMCNVARAPAPAAPCVTVGALAIVIFLAGRRGLPWRRGTRARHASASPTSELSR
jgi:hypothetical protein